MEIRAYFPDERIVVLPKIEPSPQLDALLQQLVSANID
jgi:hypothetical protein